MGRLLQGGSQEAKMILGLKIGIGIVLGIVAIKIAFWLGVVIVYGAITILESLMKKFK
jgi:hypothetical protein